jgi:hypothetical protein
LPEDSQAFQVTAPAPQLQPRDEPVDEVDDLDSGIFTDE